MASEDVIVPRYSVDGLNKVFREVRKFEPALVRETQKEMRDRMGAALQRTAGQLVKK